jgi:hypothetical protein
LLLEKAKPVPAQEAADEKEPLQLCVQLFKRWRDLFFEDPCAAPSVVLTALAGTHYQGEESVSEATLSILNRILAAIDLAESRGSRIEVRNPSNPREDFAERWDANPQAYREFKRGIRQLHRDWCAITAGGRETNKELGRLFGQYVQTVLVKRAQLLQEARRSGGIGVASSGAISGLASRVTPIPRNTFHGDRHG